MPKGLEYLNAYILGGKEIYNDPDNRSYPRSSFKRIIKGWESDLYKIIEMDASITRNREKYNKETHEKEKKKLEKQDKKLREKREQLLDKLNQKMKDEADKYLKNKKDFADESEISVAKNPKKLANIKKYKEYINNIFECYNQIYSIVKNTVQPLEQEAYSYYYSKLLKTYTKSSINFAVNEIKRLKLPNLNQIKNFYEIASDIPSKHKLIIKDIYTKPEFCSFVFAYINIIYAEKNFSNWFETEHYCITNFEDLNEEKMLEYHKHGAYINFVAALHNDSEKLVNALKKLYDFCNDIGLKNDLKHIRTKLSGYFDMCLALLLAGELLGSIVAPYYLNKGLKKYNNKKKPLLQNIYSLIDETNKELDDLIDQKPGKNDLNVRKVEYMRKISKELG